MTPSVLKAIGPNRRVPPACQKRIEHKSKQSKNENGLCTSRIERRGTLESIMSKARAPNSTAKTAKD